MSTGLNLAMIGSGVDGGFLAFLPMAYVFCCQWNRRVTLFSVSLVSHRAVVGLGALSLSRVLVDLNSEIGVLLHQHQPQLSIILFLSSLLLRWVADIGTWS